MKVVDINGIPLEVTDLMGAIAQADEFKDYIGEGDFAQQQKQYWTDLYHKLRLLENNLK